MPRASIARVAVATSRDVAARRPRTRIRASRRASPSLARARVDARGGAARGPASARIRAGADDGSKLKLPIDKSATMLLAAASYPKFCALMRQRCKAVLRERAAFDALR